MTPAPRRVRASELVRRLVPDEHDGASLDLLAWTERHRRFGGEPMRVPAPLRALYRDDSPFVVVMKGAQMGLSEWAINLALHTADSGRAGRGTALYVQPGGDNIGDFVQARVNPAVEQSPHLAARVRLGGSTRDPDKVGLRRIGPGYTYWRTAGSRPGLKSVPVDTLILDEYDEMPEGVLALAGHRLDSSTAPLTRVLSTPTYPGTGIDPLYTAGDQRRFLIPCDGCATEQALDWEACVLECDGRLQRVCSAVVSRWRRWSSGRGTRTGSGGGAPRIPTAATPPTSSGSCTAPPSTSRRSPRPWATRTRPPRRRRATSTSGCRTHPRAASSRSRNCSAVARRRSPSRRSPGCRTAGWAWTSAGASTSGSNTAPAAGAGSTSATSSPRWRWTASRNWTD